MPVAAVIALAVFALIVVALLAGLHWTEYWWISSGRGPFTTGRYLLPMVGVAGLAVATVVRRLRPAARPAAVAAAGAVLRIDGFDPSRVLELRLLDA
jgi:hypothetical protein